MSATTDRLPVYAPGLTLGDVFLRLRAGGLTNARVRDLALIVGGALLIAIGAWISFDVPQIALPGIFLPDNPYVPLTLQTFAVLFTGAALGARRAVASTALYLLIGALGFPVWSAMKGDHGGGLARIVSTQDGAIVLGVTGGYLVGFLLASLLVGRLAERGFDRRVRGAALAMLVGTVAIYAVGLPWLCIAAKLSVTDTFRYGLFPFLPGDLLKVIVAAGLLPFAWRRLERLEGGRG